MMARLYWYLFAFSLTAKNVGGSMMARLYWYLFVSSLPSKNVVKVGPPLTNFLDPLMRLFWLSPLGSPIIRKYTKPFNAFKRRGMYPYVSECNAKRCVCCTHLCTKTTITSSVNGRQFSIINNNDMD